MNCFKKAIISTIFFICALNIFAQEHNHSLHGHSRNEIGISGGVLYGIDHNAWGGGFHVHYFRTLSPCSRWSLGASAEKAWVHGSHFNIGAGVRYQLLDRLSIAVLPGITFIQHNDSHAHDTHSHGGMYSGMGMNNWQQSMMLEIDPHHHHDRKALFSTHFEVVYDLFHWRNLHFGLALDYSWKRQDSHLMLGIHTAVCF